MMDGPGSMWSGSAAAEAPWPVPKRGPGRALNANTDNITLN